MGSWLYLTNFTEWKGNRQAYIYGKHSMENHYFNEEVQRKCGRKIQITVLHSKRKIVQYFVSFAKHVMQNHWQ